jgi:putative ABC transport system permease protein
MNHSFYHLSWSDVFASLVLIVLAIGLLKRWQVKLEKTLLIGTFRTFLQLSVMGYLLTFFFQQRHWIVMVGLVLMMILIASYEGYRRQRTSRIPRYFLIVVGSLLLTVTVVLGTILNFILEVKPWFYPYAMIPLAGMIIGNGLNSITLATNRLMGELRHRERELEVYLSLGAPPRIAVQDCLRESLRAALLPNINAMMMVGLVQIPGVMTGQILAGVDPLQAIRYQIMIMYMWVTTVILVDVLVLSLVYRQFFTDREQLRYDLLRSP